MKKVIGSKKSATLTVDMGPKTGALIYDLTDPYMREEMAAAENVNSFIATIQAFDEHLRKIIKYGPDSSLDKKTAAVLVRAAPHFREVLQDYAIVYKLDKHLD